MDYSSPERCLKEQGQAQVTHLSLEALEPHDVLTAGGVLLPKVLPERVDLQGELPLHLGCLQGDTSCITWGAVPWLESTDRLPRSRSADLPSYDFCTSPVLLETLKLVEFGPGKISFWTGMKESSHLDRPH